MTMTPWVDCSSNMLEHPKQTNTPTPERVRHHLEPHQKALMTKSFKTPVAGQDPNRGADVEPKGPRHREDLLAVHRVQLLQQVRQVEQVQGGETCDEAPHGQAKASEERACCPTPAKWCEKGDERAGQAGGGDDGQPEGSHHLEDDLALRQVQLLDLQQWQVQVEQVQDEAPHPEIAHRGWESSSAAADPAWHLAGLESQFTSQQCQEDELPGRLQQLKRVHSQS